MADVSHGSDLGYTVGSWQWTALGAGTYTGVYLTVWQKEGGDWKWFVD